MSPSSVQPHDPRARRRVLAIGAHPDDVELGCGGALLRHSARGDHLSLLVLTRGERGVFENRSRFAEQRRAARILGAELHWGDFVDGELTFAPSLVSAIDAVVGQCAPDVIYTHSEHDSHQDHVAVSRASLAAGRRVSTILFYETPSTQQFQPTVFVDTTDLMDAKIALVSSHRSQVDRGGPIHMDVLEAQARFRGSQGRRPYAEGFEVARFHWNLFAAHAAPDDIVPELADRATSPWRATPFMEPVT